MPCYVALNCRCCFLADCWCLVGVQISKSEGSTGEPKRFSIITVGLGRSELLGVGLLDTSISIHNSFSESVLKDFSASLSAFS